MGGESQEWKDESEGRMKGREGEEEKERPLSGREEAQNRRKEQ